ncbi:HAD-IIIA family hydrolase [Aeromicrobium sp. Marseille-Q0843]|uniref:D,D-heptose 1,7-bisphosphate phosphatase n=1 Tax=Aeromicrobium phoceense TaxID=2754045 RepID=A0A838XIE3_9ACTN|nr:HAD-IIIA family hydrolase [Aeromicrobium phoceense]MBA4609862.1 HAD-IIIA family hydrolase [Aeromicrobium phoceense]
MSVDTTIVVPTIGRDTLRRLLESLDAATGGTPDVIVVDDRREGEPLDLPAHVRVLASGGRGPAAARNLGWRAATTEWISFVDDDVIVAPDWIERLTEDLASADDDVVAVQGRLTVPRPAGRRLTDAERSTASLETAQWITADLSVRRRALRRVSGFDERFTRAYREDADLGLRLSAHGRIVAGRRTVVHPFRSDGTWFSLRQQRGNADDVLMRRLHGPDWRERAGAPRGTLRRHQLTVMTAVAGVLLAAAGRPQLAGLLAGAWATLTARFAWARIAPGPRDQDEVRRMALTSVAIPFAAVRWWLDGLVRDRDAVPRRRLPDAVLFDPDGTLVHDVPYNREPARVAPIDGVHEALARLREAGVPTGVVSNQSGVARGLIAPDELEAVNRRVEELLGPFGTWQVCRHAPEDGCECRKPQPGLVLRACDELGVDVERCVVVGDIGADVEAAAAAGATGVLVPTRQTLGAEVAAAPRVEPDVLSAVRSILRGHW